MAAFFIAVGSVYGAADLVAEKVEQFLVEAGHSVEDVTLSTPDYLSKLDKGVLLIITSTTGSGDLPDSIVPFFSAMRDNPPRLSQLKYGVIALGDSCYGDTFCGAGRQFDEMLENIGGQRVGEMLKLDASETFEPEMDAVKWLPSWLLLLDKQDVGVA